LSKLDFEGRKKVEVNADSQPLIDPKTGTPVTEIYEKNKDIITEYGVKDNQVVIRSFDVPSYYLDDQVKDMVKYGRKNIGNCPHCEKVRYKYRHMFDDVKKKIPLSASRSHDSWVVDLQPSEPIKVRKIINDGDIAIGLGLDGKKRIVPKKMAFPTRKYSYEQALELANRRRKEIVKKDWPLPPTKLPRPPNTLPSPPRRSLLAPPPVKKSSEISGPRIRFGVLPNIVEWRRNRKRIMD